jgi:hypothetical protein
LKSRWPFAERGNGFSIVVVKNLSGINYALFKWGLPAKIAA